MQTLSVVSHFRPARTIATRFARCNKFLEFPRPEVSFVAKIDDLHQDNVRLTREISKWERRVAIESERRRAAELEAGKLKVTIQQLQMDNGKLEKHIREWKLIAEESKSNADRYYREMNKIFTALNQVKSELACTSMEEHLG